MFPKEFVDSIGQGLKSLFIMALCGILCGIGLFGYLVYRITTMLIKHFAG